MNWNSDKADVLREVGNIGAAHAATALSALLQEPVRISVTSARLCRFDEISETVGGPEAVCVGIFLRMTGDIHGSMMLLLSVPSARRLLHRLLPTEAGEGDFSELEVSALAEVGNILGGSYVSAIGTLTSLHIQPSVPAVGMDMAGAILDIVILSVGETSDSALLIDTSIHLGASEISGHFFLLPDPESLAPLLQTLGSGA